MTSNEANIFLESALAEIPRLLGQLNRSKSSKTYGSFDRAFWHYRVNDISSARYQEGVLTLALLYTSSFPGNIYYKSNKVRAWIDAALHFTASIARSDGSFDEWYINEGSFVCTSFVAAALSETLLVLKDEQISSHKEMLMTLRKSADWINNHEETVVLNQVAGAIVALQNMYMLTREEKYKKAAQKKATTLLKKQKREGWWSEYGGPDIGYLSLTIDYLSRYYEKTRDTRVQSAFAKAVSFLSHFIHPDFTAGGEYMARNTEYLIPSGFARLAPFNEEARFVLGCLSYAHKEKVGIGPWNLDDRYLCYVLYNWIYAGLAIPAEIKEPSEEDLFSRSLDTFFMESGIYVLQNKQHYIVVNLKKGGSFRFYTKEGVYIDSGLEFNIGSRCFLSGVLDEIGVIKRMDAMLATSGHMHELREPLLATFSMLVFKTFQFTFGRLPLLRAWVKKMLRKRSVAFTGDTTAPAYKRTFSFKGKKITVVDTIFGEYPHEEIRYGEKSSYTFIPSSKYFSPSEIKHALPERPDAVYAVENGETTLTRIFHIR